MSPDASPSNYNQQKLEESGNLMEIDKKRRESPMKNHKKAQEPKQKFTATFVQDIDNFRGIKKVSNFAIQSIKDDSYKMGDISVGVMQLHNKLEGKNVTMEDMNRIEQVGKFIGALSIKA